MTIALAFLTVPVLCGIAVTGVFAVEPLRQAQDQGRSNVIIVMTDDQGYSDMSCHGHPILETPNLDRLSQQSVRFADFHVDPYCTPTRAALLTGRISHRTGATATYGTRNFLRRTETTMAEHFKASGYRTGIFGKWHLGGNYLDVPGVALEVKGVELTLSDRVALSKDVEPGAGAVTFDVDLPASDLELQARLILADGKKTGAYYVYARKI